MLLSMPIPPSAILGSRLWTLYFLNVLISLVLAAMAVLAALLLRDRPEDVGLFPNGAGNNNDVVENIATLDGANHLRANRRSGYDGSYITLDGSMLERILCLYLQKENQII